MVKNKASEAERILSRAAAEPEKLDPSKALSSGSTLLNLALTGTTHGAFYAGKYYRYVGDSSSGKTMLTLTCFAESVRHPLFKGHRLIHDNSEDGSLMDMTQFFGRTCASKIEPPRGTRADPVFSHTVEELYYYLDDAFKAKVPFIYVKDSMDSLNTEDDEDKFQARKKAHDTGKETTGTFGMAKAKLNAGGLRTVFAKLRESESIVIFISHALANVNPMTAKFFPKTDSGGKALKYYAHGEIWTSLGGSIVSRVRGKDRKLGIRSRVRVQKNRQTGRDVEVEVPILWSSGIDDVGACVDFLVEEKHWQESKTLIHADDFGVTLKREELIQSIQDHDQEGRLRTLVGRVWRDLQREMTPNRKARYADDE